MNIKSGQSWSDAFVCLDSTGALSTPSVGPSGVLYKNGVVDAAVVTISGSNPYKWSTTVPVLAAGDQVSIYITATIGGVATAGIVSQAQGDTYRISDVIADTDDIQSKIGVPIAIDSGGATIVGMLTKMVDDNAGATFDATYDSLNKIKGAVVAGVAQTIQATSNVETTGTLIGGTYASTYLSNGAYYTTAPVTPAVGGFGLNVYLGFAVATGQYINSVTIRGYYNGNAARNVNVYAYNWISLGWDQLSDSTTRMNHATANQLYTYTLLSSHQKADGTVRIGFMSTSTTTSDRVYIDQCLVNVATAGASAADIAEAVKQKLIVNFYEAGVWIDTISGVAGTTLGTNGTPTNPVNTYADALTIANNLGVKRFYLKPDSVITLNQSHANWRFIGKGLIALGGQAIDDAIFEDSEQISGISTGDDATFINCQIRTSTIGEAYFNSCGFDGTLTLLASKNYTMHQCYDANPSTATQPIINFAGTNNVGLRAWTGGVELANMHSTDYITADGAGRIVIGSTCSANPNGTITIRGPWAACTDNVAGGFKGIITDTARWSEDQNITNVTGYTTNLTNLPTIPLNWITASGLDNSAVLEIQTGLATPTNITAGTITTVGTVTNPVTAGTVSDKSGYTINGTLTTIDALWDKIKKWLQLGFRKDTAIATDNAVELGEINANMGTGVGAYVSTTDSQEAIRDKETDIETDTQFASYMGAIWFDSHASNTNTAIGVDGTPNNPVSSTAAVQTLIASTGFKIIRVKNLLTVISTDNLSNLYITSWDGQHNGSNNVQYNAGVGTNALNETIISNLAVQLASNGTAGRVYCQSCSIIFGIANVVARGGNVQIGTVGDSVSIEDSIIWPNETLNLSAISNGQTIYMNRIRGDVTFTNLAAGRTVQLDLDGRITLDATCSGGTINLYGNCELVNNAPGVTVNDYRTTLTADLTEILEYPLAETLPGQLEGGFEHFFDVAAPTGDINDLPVSGIGLTSQETRDSMMLAPTPGVPDVGSIDKHLDDAALESTLTAIKGGTWTTENLKAIYDQIMLRLLTSGYTAPPTAVAIASQVDTTLSGTHGAGSWGGAAGSGTVAYPYLVRKADGTPIPDALVEVSSTVTKTIVIASGYTDATGYVTFYLDPNTYYFFTTKAGYSFTNPDTEIVI
jgi:hypothetical protein